MSATVSSVAVVGAALLLMGTSEASAQRQKTDITRERISQWAKAKPEDFALQNAPTDATRWPYDLMANFYRTPLPAGQEAYGRIQGERMLDSVNEIVAFSYKDRDSGSLVWGRIPGSKVGYELDNWLEAKLKDLGLQDVHQQPVDLRPQSFPTSWSMSATGGGQTATFTSVGASGASLPPGGKDLEPVWVGLGTESDFANRDVKDKLVVIWSAPTPGVVGNTAGYLGAVQRAAKHGAAAAVVNLAFPGNYQWSRASDGGRGLPTFNLGTDDTNTLRAMMEKGPVKVHATYTADVRSVTDYNIWGTLPGTTDEDILITAHHDAYFAGAEDNASGMAVLMELAKYYAAIPQAQRRRTIKFVFTTGHHGGVLTARQWHENKDTFLAKTALIINLEHIGTSQRYYWWSYTPTGPSSNPPLMKESNLTNALSWWIYGSPKLAEIGLGNLKMFNVPLYDSMEPQAAGDMVWAATDAPSMQVLSAQTSYHTNIPEHISPWGLESAARAYAKTIDDINKLDRKDLLPIKPVTTPAP